MPRRKRLDQPGCPLDPAIIGRKQRFGRLGAAAGARLVGELPGHDRRIAGMALHRGADIVAIQAHRLGIGIELRGHVRECRPRVRGIVHVEILAAIRPAEIGHHSARPFPEIGEVEHRLHVAPGEFREREGQAFDQCRVPGAAPGAEGGLHRIPERRILGRSGDAQVADAHRGKGIEFAAQAIAIAPGGIGAQPGGVPHIRADEAMGLAAEEQARAPARDEIAGRGSGDGEGQRGAGQRGGTRSEHGPAGEHGLPPLLAVTS